MSTKAETSGSSGGQPPAQLNLNKADPLCCRLVDDCGCLADCRVPPDRSPAARSVPLHAAMYHSPHTCKTSRIVSLTMNLCACTGDDSEDSEGPAEVQHLVLVVAQEVGIPGVTLQCRHHQHEACHAHSLFRLPRNAWNPSTTSCPDCRRAHVSN